MTIQVKRQKVLDFYKTFIEGYILEGIKILQVIQPDSKRGLGGCTVPLAMAIISSMDLLGFLLKNDGDTKKSGDNISHFINFPNLFPIDYNGDAVDKICNYRQGMMHHFFPKFKGQFAGICKNENDESLFIHHLINGNREESLNVTVFTVNFVKALKTLKDYLEQTDDESIFDTILKGLKNLDYYVQMPSTTTTCTTINPGTPKNK